jgi:HK97 family phage major capsid protein
VPFGVSAPAIRREAAMNELILKLQTEAADLLAAKEAALVASEKDGITSEEREKHVAEAEAAAAKLKDVNARLGRLVATRDERAALDAHLSREREPATQPITMRPFAPNGRPTVAPSSGVRIPANVRRLGTLKAFKGPDADKDAYVSGLFIAAHFLGHGPSRQRLDDMGVQATLSTIDNTRGGYFVPDVMDNSILRLLEDYGTARRLATMVPMTSDTWSKPRQTGGITAYWVSEGAAPTQTGSPTFDRISLVAKNLAAYDKITVQLNEDAVINLADEWAVMAANKFAYEEDNAAFNGDGTSTYGGITGLLPKVIASANAASLVTATGHATLASLTLGDFETVVGKKPRYPGYSPRWFMSQDVYAASVMRLQDAIAGNNWADIEGKRMPTFLTYPVEIVNAMPAAASVTTGVTGILFGDLSMSTHFGDRRQRAMRVTEINDDAIKQMQTLFMAERVDINNHTVIDPITSTKAGPMIGLKLG